MLLGLSHRWLPPQPSSDGRSTAAAAVALGAVVAAIAAVAAALVPDAAPQWPAMEAAGSLVPTLAAALVPVGSWALRTAVLLFVLALVHAGTTGWTRRRLPASVGLVVLGVVLAGGRPVESIGMWLIGGLLVGVVLVLSYVLVLRHHHALLPLAGATVSVLGVLAAGWQRAYPGALPGAILAAVLIAALGWLWTGRLEADCGIASMDGDV
jgi:hypothetical protein